jgi:hypothetical protein
MKKQRRVHPSALTDDAVSEIVGTLILVTIAVSVFSAVSLIILNPWSNFSDVSTPEVTLVGFIDTNSIVIEHRGGIPLSQKTKIVLTISDVVTIFHIDEFSYWVDQNNDGLWTIGERVVYPAGALQGKQVTCLVVDVDKNFAIFDKVIQKGISVFSPSITALPPDDVTETSATLKLYYDFYNISHFSSGLLNFTYGPFGGPYIDSPSVKPLSLSGWYGLQLTGLVSGNQYEYWAWMNYTNGTMIAGPITFYTYQTTRGLWHFDEAIGSTLAYDAMNPASDGIVHEATFIPGGKSNGSLNFMGASDYVEVPHHPKFNVDSEITIEAWVNVSKVGAQFPGNVSELYLKNISDIFGNTCFEPDLINIIGTIYAVAYHDTVSAYITTFQMTDDGVFQGVIDTKTIPVPHCYEPDIINIHHNIYAVAYGASDDQPEAKNYLVTLPIYENGTIGGIIDTFTFPEYYGREANIINIDNDVYALTIGGTFQEIFPTGYLVTVSISNQGAIASTLIDTLKLPLSNSCSETSMVPLSAGLYAITYNGYGATAGNGYIVTVRVLSNGSIVKPVQDLCQFTLPSSGLEPTMIPVRNEIYAISYGADSNNQLRTGFIKTVRINSIGHVINASIDILPFYTYLSPIDYNFETDIIHIDDKLYAISFTGGNNSNWQRGFLTTISIEDTGNISDTALFIYEFKGCSALGGTSAVKLTNHKDRLIIVYGSINASEQGFLTMEKIDLLGQEKLIIHKGDAYSIAVNYNLVTAKMVIGDVMYAVSGTIGFDSWIKIDFTYSSGSLKLYINNIIQTGGSLFCSGAIKTNMNPLIFGGGVYGSIDEVKIFRGVYVPP